MTIKECLYKIFCCKCKKKDEEQEIMRRNSPAQVHHVRGETNMDIKSFMRTPEEEHRKILVLPKRAEKYAPGS